MDFRGGMSANQYEDASSSRDSSLARSEPDQQETGPRKGTKNLDRRRESSRYAARDRRGKEADIFVDLKDVVPIVEESTVTHVDRIALLRVASTMCRMRRNAAKFLSWQANLLAEDPEVHVFTEQNLTEALDGFVLLADSDGTILYVSESVSLFLGLTQTDLVGRFLKDFVHNDDYDELVRWSTTDCDTAETSTLDDFGRYLVVRMKSVISPRGRTLNLKSALFKSILCRFRAVTNDYGRLSLIYGSSTPAGQGNALMLANSAVKGAEATSGVYMTRHTCDMRFSYVSDSLNFLLRHDSRSLMGSSFYDLVHPSDVGAVAHSFRELFKKSHCRTPFYRLLGANSSVAWAQTEATTVNHTARGQKGQYVLCVHSIVGMQSEAESWSEPIVDCSEAAHPAICVSRIKREIPDMAEYMGKQPEFVECVDFTPLIDPVSDVNFNDFNPVRPVNGRGRNGNRRQTDLNDLENAPSTKQKRKKSYDDVLQWLVRDQVDSPPPFHGPDYGSSEDMFPDQSDPNLAIFNNRRGSPNENDQSFRGNFTTVNNSAPGFGSNQFFSNNGGRFRNAATGQTPATALVGRANVNSGATATLPNNGQYQRRGNNGFGMVSSDMEEEERKQDFYDRPMGQQRVSRYDIHCRKEQRRGGAGTITTIVGSQRSPAPRTISSIPSAAGNTLSSANQNQYGRQGATNLHSTMHSAVPTQANQRSGCTSTNDEPQFVGEYYRRRAGSSNRSRSSSSSASYECSAARRYSSSQNSPAPPIKRSNTRGTTESRKQCPVNVNQLNAVPAQLQEYNYNNQHMFNGSPTSGPNFYYAARNTQNSNGQNFQQQQMRSGRSIERMQNNYAQDCYVPAKRQAFGCDEPVSDFLQQAGQCEDLSNLAPFVSGDDMHQLNEQDWENLLSFPDCDFSEVFPNEMPCNPPPVMNQKQMSPFKNQMMDQMDCSRPMPNQNQQQFNNMMVGPDQNWGFDQY